MGISGLFVSLYVQICLSEMNVVDSDVEVSVLELVDHMWTEATGHLDDVLSVPPASVTSEQAMM